MNDIQTSIFKLIIAVILQSACVSKIDADSETPDGIYVPEDELEETCEILLLRKPSLDYFPIPNLDVSKGHTDLSTA